MEANWDHKQGVLSSSFGHPFSVALPQPLSLPVRLTSFCAELLELSLGGAWCCRRSQTCRLGVRASCLASLSHGSFATVA